VALRILGEPHEQLVPLLLEARGAGVRGRAVSFIRDDEFGRVLQELGAVRIALDVVDADHDVGEVAEDAVGGRGQPALEAAHRAGANDLGGEAKLVFDLLLPLVAEVRRAEDAGAGDLSAVEQFAGDEQRFDGLADADVVGDEHAHGVEPQRHQQRDELVRARADTDPSERAERAGGIAERKPGGVKEQRRGGRVAGGLWIGQRELRAFHAVEPEVGEAPVDAGDLLLKTGEGPEKVQLVVRRRQNDPLAVAAAHDGADGNGRHQLTPWSWSRGSPTTSL
jgi:hypothetical protein